ncbi:MAG: DUF1330 domain-containing protein [Gammaproteobacteria bacterium]|jgi:uncharacterized protein (DUF1330 family)
MSAYLIANYTINDPAGYDAYVAAVGPTIFAHGGEILVAGPGSTPVEGAPGEVTVVLRFPSMAALQGWYDSPEYQAIIDLRRNSTDGHLVFAEQFVLPG